MIKPGSRRTCIPGGGRNAGEGCHKDQFVNYLFQVPKKNEGQWPVINLKDLNIFKQGNYLWKLDLSDASFCVPLTKQSRKYVRFKWEGSLYKFLCLCFGISLAPRLFTKLIITSISILRNFYIRIRVYLDTSEYIVNAGGVNKRPSQAFGNIIINSVSNSSFTTVHEIPAETTNL